ncbi:curli-like amyloid fiber formation chaperone CsgH [Aurantibacter sp.]|uniref:curli-like amyloid fiber formation chaperone CsgH n=1 Tax=Aurantibacter sp. TaxID=2807103 RepID=UPI003266B348
MKYSFIVIICLLCHPMVSYSQIYNKDVSAAVDLEIQDNSIINITGSAHNKTQINKSLRYVLSVIKSGNNSNTNKQEGRFVLAPGAKKNLSNTSINVNDDDRTIILLLVYENDKVVGKDRKVLNGIEGEEDEVKNFAKPEINKDVKESKEDGFVLKGVVIEDTKTKAGNDFYDMFYSLYLSNNINADKIVKIEERLAIGSNTQINILVEDEVVVQFFVNPRTQYLKSMADNSIYRVNTYLQRLKANKEQITRY